MKQVIVLQLGCLRDSGSFPSIGVVMSIQGNETVHWGSKRACPALYCRNHS